jgi:hypothetical protein
MFIVNLANAQIVKGKVICNTYAVSKVEVINHSKKIPLSDADNF